MYVGILVHIFFPNELKRTNKTKYIPCVKINKLGLSQSEFFPQMTGKENNNYFVHFPYGEKFEKFRQFFFHTRDMLIFFLKKREGKRLFAFRM